METNERKCDGQCQKCTLLQQTYCSAVRMHALIQHEPILFSRLEKIEEAMKAIEQRLIQFGEPVKDIAPIGAGADNTAPESQNNSNYGL